MFFMRDANKQGVATLRDFRLSMLGMADGRVPGASALHRFGYNPTVDTSFETVWVETGLYQFRSTAATLTLSSDSVEDAVGSPGGTGALTVTIEGLDSSYAEISETALMNGLGGVTLANQYLRVSRAFVATAGSVETNVGNVYIGSGSITAGKPAQVDAHIGPDTGETQLGVYTVPADTTGYLLTLMVFAARAANANIDVRMRIRPLNAAWRDINHVLLFQNDVGIERLIPEKIAAKTDIEFQAKTSSGTSPVAVKFEMLLVTSAFEWV